MIFVTTRLNTDAYVNFHIWYYYDNNFIHEDIRYIAIAFPCYHSLSIYLHVDKNHNVLRKFILKCCVNLTIRNVSKDPIQQLEKRVIGLQKESRKLKIGGKLK